MKQPASSFGERCMQLVIKHEAGSSGHAHYCTRPARVFENGNWWCAYHSRAAREERYQRRKAKDESAK
jgi:hypothetical protein